MIGTIADLVAALLVTTATAYLIAAVLGEITEREQTAWYAFVFVAVIVGWRSLAFLGYLT